MQIMKTSTTPSTIYCLCQIKCSMQGSDLNGLRRSPPSDWHHSDTGPGSENHSAFDCFLRTSTMKMVRCVPPRKQINRQPGNDYGPSEAGLKKIKSWSQGPSWAVTFRSVMAKFICENSGKFNYLFARLEALSRLAMRRVDDIQNPSDKGWKAKVKA